MYNRTNEQVAININDPSTIITLSVRDYNTVGKDQDIGMYELKVVEVYEPGNDIKDLWVNLVNGGQGKLHIRLEFKY